MAINLDSFLPKSEQTPVNSGNQPILWIDGSDHSNLILNGNNEVFGFLDKSFIGGRFVQLDFSSSVSIPVLGRLKNRSAFVGTPVNGIYGVDFFAPTSELVIFVTYFNNDGVIITNGAGDFVIDSSGISVSGASASPAELSDSDYHILALKWDAVSGDLFVKFDDQDGSVVDNDTTLLSGSIGGGPSDIYFLNNVGVASGTTGSVGEVIIYGKSLSDLQFNRVGKYLCTKWGLLWSDI
jgi:hypothetical protein